MIAHRRAPATTPSSAAVGPDSIALVGPGNDQLFGEGGKDQIDSKDTVEADTIDGGSGADTLRNDHRIDSFINVP